MMTLDNQILPFIEPEFNAEEAAQHFFASYSEIEINKKLKEMNTIQSAIEDVLKKKVRGNYPIFLQATDEINRVGLEMNDLKHLIENTQKLINDVKSNKLSESRAMRVNSLLTSIHQKVIQEDRNSGGNDSEMEFDNVTGMPPLLLKALDDINRAMIEQSYQEAVNLITQTKNYLIQVTSASSTSMESTLHLALLEVLKKVHELSTQLALRIKKTLSKLPNSPLWGSKEQLRRLKLLVDLGEYHLAAEAFTFCQAATMKKVLGHIVISSQHSYAKADKTDQPIDLTANLNTTITTTTDSFSHTTDILTSFIAFTSRNFFHTVYYSCHSFSDLFRSDSLTRNENGHATYQPPSRSELPNRNEILMKTKVDAARNEVMDTSKSNAVLSAQPSVMSLLLIWLQSQMVAFAQSISTQIQLNMQEQTAVIIIHLRQLVHSNDTKMLNKNDLLKGMEPLALQTLISNVGVGSLTVVAKCIDIIFHEVSVIDGLQLFQGRSCLGWTFLPEIQKFVVLYGEEFIKEVSVQVNQDDWSPLFATPLLPTSSTNKQPTTTHQPKTIDISSSFLWVAIALHHFCDEVEFLLNEGDVVDDSNRLSQSTTQSCSYTRADVCEVEPVAVACFLRILLRYVIEVEAVDTKSFNRQQLNCYILTMEAINSYLLPKVLNDFILQRFFPLNGSNAASSTNINMINTSFDPSSLLTTLTNRISAIISKKQKQISQISA